MEQSEARLRQSIIFTLFLGTLVCLITDSSFYFYYKVTNVLIYSDKVYIFLRIFLPLIVNSCAVAIAFITERSTRFPSATKNMVCAFALCTICGSVSIFHGYFTPLWFLPSIAVLFCSLFHDTLMMFALQLYNYILIFISYFYESTEYNTETAFVRFLSQDLIIVLVISTVTMLISMAMGNYNHDLIEQTQKYYERQLIYRRRYRIDSLTQVYSRQYLDVVAPQMLNEASEVNPVSAILLDIDKFKHVNDTYGHAAGDAVLERLGQLCQKFMQAPFFAGRYGGEEFIILLSGQTPSENKILIEHLRKDFAATKYSFTTEQFTISGGMTTVKEPSQFAAIFKKIDEALYFSKNNGRDQLTIV